MTGPRAYDSTVKLVTDIADADETVYLDPASVQALPPVTSISNGVMTPAMLAQLNDTFESSTADQAGWQAAINAAVAAGGGVVNLKPNANTVVLTAPLTVGAGVNVPLSINAYGVKVQPPAGLPAFYANTGVLGYLAVAFHMAGMQIIDLGRVGDGIKIRNSMNWRFEDVYINGTNIAKHIVNDGAGNYSENNVFDGVYDNAANYGVYLETINGATSSMDGCIFQGRGSSACAINAIYWGAGVSMHGGGFRDYKIWNTTDNARSVYLDSSIVDATLDLKFDNTSVNTGIIGLYIGPNVPASSLRFGKIKMQFTGLSTWTKVAFDGAAVELNAAWDEGGFLHALGSNTTTFGVVKVKSPADSTERFSISVDGTLHFGPGTTATDVNLYRTTPNGIASYSSDQPLFPGGGILSLTNTQTASYTAVLADRRYLVVEMNVGTANTFTVPPNSSVAYPIGSSLRVCQLGVGITTITPGAGVTLRNGGAYTMRQYEEVEIRKRNTDEWVVVPKAVAPRWTLVGEYTTAGTTSGVVIPAGTTEMKLVVVGGSGGGGSGRRSLVTTAFGGGGGGGGSMAQRVITNAVAMLAAGDTLTVVVGAAGTGGAAQTVDATDGNPGTAGIASTVTASVTGLLLRAVGGAGGSGGTTAAGTGGGASSSDSTGGTGSSSSITTAPGAVTSTGSAGAGGGAGGGISVGGAAFNGGLGGAVNNVNIGGGSGGVVGGATPTAATGPTAAQTRDGLGFGGGGGGGAASVTAAAQAGGAGASCAGGGGGGASLSGFASGAGGAGQPGYVAIWALVGA